MLTANKIVLDESTPLKKEIASRVRKGVALLDAVNPGWYLPINPKTLKVSNRESCVFSRASHDFETGIQDTAAQAILKNIPVDLMPVERIPEISWEGAASSPHLVWNRNADRGWGRYEWKGGPVIDVFAYGFDVDPQLKNDERFRADNPYFSRRPIWAIIEKAWFDVVTQKKAADATHQLRNRLESGISGTPQKRHPVQAASVPPKRVRRSRNAGPALRKAD